MRILDELIDTVGTELCRLTGVYIAFNDITLEGVMLKIGNNAMFRSDTYEHVGRSIVVTEMFLMCDSDTRIITSRKYTEPMKLYEGDALKVSWDLSVGLNQEERITW